MNVLKIFTYLMIIFGIYMCGRITRSAFDSGNSEMIEIAIGMDALLVCVLTIFLEAGLL